MLSLEAKAGSMRRGIPKLQGDHTVTSQAMLGGVS
jgi:hypothetical protein